MHKTSGGCHCGNIAIDVELTAEPGTYHPRACDCEFCCKHGAAWLSDAKGALRVQIKNAHALGNYWQGSEQAEFVLCRNCGVLAAVLHRTGQKVHAAVNVRALAGAAKFGAEQVVSPQKLSAIEKAARWEGIWFGDVQILGDDQSEI